MFELRQKEGAVTKKTKQGQTKPSTFAVNPSNVNQVHHKQLPPSSKSTRFLTKSLIYTFSYTPALHSYSLEAGSELAASN